MALDGFISELAPLVGVERACRAFGTPARSFRHRQRRAREASSGDPSMEVVLEDDGGEAPAAAANAAALVIEPVVIDADVGAVALPPADAPLGPRHPAALSSEERFAVLEVLCSERFVDLSPHQVFMTLLDEQRYLCSVRSMYRLLEEHGLSGDRRRGGHRAPGHYPKPVVHASGPNQAWSWDITKLRGPTKGVLYYLYTILDIFSRKIVAWTIAERESVSVAYHLTQRAVEREGVERDQLTLHADRGGPMIAGDIAELLTGLGVSKSHSRPRVSNDKAWASYCTPL